MINKIVASAVSESIDFFFAPILCDLYDHKRKTLEDLKPNSKLVIDYILQSQAASPLINYPPKSSALWCQIFNKLYTRNHYRVYGQVLLVYLRQDIKNYLKQKKVPGKCRTDTELALLGTKLNELDLIIESFDFKNSVVHLAKGLWAVDNQDKAMIMSSLCYPNLDLSHFFESPREILSILIENLIIQQEYRVALCLTKIHHFEGFHKDYDAMYAFILISSGQLAEALNYERLFVDNENYPQILQKFFELTSEFDLTQAFNCLNLNVEEETALNQYLACESRPVTPALPLRQTNQDNTNPSVMTPAVDARNRSTHNSSVSKSSKLRNRHLRNVHQQQTPPFRDSPARNTRSARKKKTTE